MMCVTLRIPAAHMRIMNSEWHNGTAADNRGSFVNILQVKLDLHLWAVVHPSSRSSKCPQLHGCVRAFIRLVRNMHVRKHCTYHLRFVIDYSAGHPCWPLGQLALMFLKSSQESLPYLCCWHPTSKQRILLSNLLA